MEPGTTYIFVQNYTEHCLKSTLEIQELKDIILCVLLMNMINNSHNMLIMVAAVVAIQHDLI